MEKMDRENDEDIKLWNAESRAIPSNPKIALNINPNNSNTSPTAFCFNHLNLIIISNSSLNFVFLIKGVLNIANVITHPHQPDVNYDLQQNRPDTVLSTYRCSSA